MFKTNTMYRCHTFEVFQMHNIWYILRGVGFTMTFGGYIFLNKVLCGSSMVIFCSWITILELVVWIGTYLMNGPKTNMCFKRHRE